MYIPAAVLLLHWLECTLSVVFPSINCWCNFSSVVENKRILKRGLRKIKMKLWKTEKCVQKIKSYQFYSRKWWLVLQFIRILTQQFPHSLLRVNKWFMHVFIIIIDSGGIPSLLHSTSDQKLDSNSIFVAWGYNVEFTDKQKKSLLW